jgi:hypothetical protein
MIAHAPRAGAQWGGCRRSAALPVRAALPLAGRRCSAAAPAVARRLAPGRRAPLVVTAIADSDTDREKGREFRRTVRAPLGGGAATAPGAALAPAAAAARLPSYPPPPACTHQQVFYQQNWRVHRSITRYFRHLDGARLQRGACAARAASCGSGKLQRAAACTPGHAPPPPPPPPALPLVRPQASSPAASSAASCRRWCAC